MEGREVRRRLVQSTLFPHSGSFIKETQNGDTDEVSIVMAEKDLNVSGKKRRGSCMRLNQKSTTPISCSKEVIKNGLASSISQSVNESSSLRKASRQLKEHQDGMKTPQNKFCPSKSTPRKEKKISTPKETRSSTPNKRMKCIKTAIGVIPFDISTDGHTSQGIPDLRLEAKLAAEESSQIFAGRKTHPFFTFRKGVATQHFAHMEIAEKKEMGLTFHPIHILQNAQDEHGTLDWGCWYFSDISVGSIECERSAVHGCSGSLKLDSFLNVAKKIICSEGNRDHNEIFSESTEVFQGYEFGRIGLQTKIPCDGSPELLDVDIFLRERILFDGHATHSQLENCLWTYKYQPQSAKQVCGNGDSVESISEWLQIWHKKDTSNGQVSVDNDDSAVYDSDHSYQQSDSEVYAVDNGLRNVLLVTGPVGSGKSAAIYACARDQGFRIIEINASDWRNGALVKQKFGEAMESHWLQGGVESFAEVHGLISGKSIEDVDVCVHGSDEKVTELTPSQQDVSQDAPWDMKAGLMEKPSACNLNQTKALVLFEDVDASLPEDHGFITTIQQLAATAKRPIILTSNSENPVLPKNLNRSQVRFTPPSAEELLGLAYMICAAEKVNPLPYFVERCVQHCQGDIRKAIILLQFWCQGLALERGRKLHSTYSPVLFDVDAGHDILPTVTFGGYPSQLSDIVAEEVDKYLNMRMEAHCLAETRDGLKDSMPEKIHSQDAKPASVLKKEMILSMHSLDGFEPGPFYDLSCSPMAFSKRDRRRKFILGPSHSENDGSYSIDAEVPFKDDGTASNFISSEGQEIPVKEICQSGASKFEMFSLHLTERLGISHLDDPCKSQDMAMPSIFPKTEIIKETEFYSAKLPYCHSINGAENLAFVGQNLLPVSKLTGGGQLMSLHMLNNNHETLISNCGVGTDAALGVRVGGSFSQFQADVPKEYQPLDECSHVDFERKYKSLDDYEANGPKEAWKRLYDQRQNLSNHVTTEEFGSCQLLKLTHGLCALISEADLLLRECRGVVSDALNSTVAHTEKIYDNGYSQLEMSSVVAEHGLCFYAKAIASSGASLAESSGVLNLASEMLTHSRSSVALGKLASFDRSKFDILKKRSIKASNLSTRRSNSDTSLCNVLQTLLPSKSYLSVKGGAFHEYVSTLGQISRYEAFRLSDRRESNKQRRAYVSRHYLGSGSFEMSSEEISRFKELSNYKKSSRFFKEGPQ